MLNHTKVHVDNAEKLFEMLIYISKEGPYGFKEAPGFIDEIYLPLLARTDSLSHSRTSTGKDL